MDPNNPPILDNVQQVSPVMSVNTPPVAQKRQLWGLIIGLFLVLGGGLGIGGYYVGLQHGSKNEEPQIALKREALAVPVDNEIGTAIEDMRVAIPETHLELRIPEEYESLSLERDLLLGLEPVLSYQRPIQNEDPDSRPDIDNLKIFVVNSALSPSEWTLDNIRYQGMTLRELGEEGSQGEFVTVKGLEFFSLNTGCCGMYQKIYILSTTNQSNEPVLVIFATNYMVMDDGVINRSLDKFVETLRSLE